MPPASIEDEGEVGELKKLYGEKVIMLGAIFPDWSDQDLVFALKETDGDLEMAIDRIASGRSLSAVHTQSYHKLTVRRHYRPMG